VPHRSDIWIDWAARIVVVDSPSTELTVSDLITTVRDHEAGPQNADDAELLDPTETAGNQDLGGGRRVGLTGTFAGSQVAFDQRPASVASGTITTANAAGLRLIDSGASFSGNVDPGALVFNVTDGASVGTVIEVVSNTELRLMSRLFDGTNNDFEIGDAYKVWNVVQCELTGGNLVNTAGNPVFPTAFTQVVRESDVSASLISGSSISASDVWSELQANNNTVNTMGHSLAIAKYCDRIWLDYATGDSGTDVGVNGTPGSGAKTWAEALTLSAATGINSFEAKGLSNTTLTATFLGRFQGNGSVLQPNNQVIAGFFFLTNFFGANFASGSTVVAEQCAFLGANNLEASLIDCQLQGTISIRGRNIWAHCGQGDAALIIDFQSLSGVELQCVQFSGDVTLQNAGTGNVINFHIQGGTVTVDSSCAAGTIIVNGVGSPVVDQSGPGCTVIDRTEAASVWSGSQVGNDVVDTMGRAVNEVKRLLALETSLPLHVLKDGSRRFVGNIVSPSIDQTITEDATEIVVTRVP
jgi:hypothetical protein